MKFSLFTGTWRLVNEEVEKDVRVAVREVLEKGNTVVTGGATGVDYFAMDECLKLFPDASRLKVIIPANLDDFINDYRTNWMHDPITAVDIDRLKENLSKIKMANPEALVEMPYSEITQEHYNERNLEEIKISDEVYAFQVNDSSGTQHTIDNAVAHGLPIILHKKYSI